MDREAAHLGPLRYSSTATRSPDRISHMGSAATHAGSQPDGPALCSGFHGSADFAGGSQILAGWLLAGSWLNEAATFGTAFIVAGIVAMLAHAGFVCYRGAHHPRTVIREIRIMDFRISPLPCRFQSRRRPRFGISNGNAELARASVPVAGNRPCGTVVLGAPHNRVHWTRRFRFLPQFRLFRTPSGLASAVRSRNLPRYPRFALPLRARLGDRVTRANRALLPGGATFLRFRPARACTHNSWMAYRY